MLNIGGAGKKELGREIVRKLQGKVDPQLMEVLVTMAERQNSFEQSLNEMAKMLDDALNIIMAFTNVAENMKSATERLTKMADNPEHDDAN
jgi:transcriptional regulator with GAF, ATPase, and Fis domain